MENRQIKLMQKFNAQQITLVDESFPDKQQ
jgi:hypothetical protein